MNSGIVPLLIALGLALAAAFMDVQQHRIPNWLTYPGMAVGVLLRGLLLGWKGVVGALVGCLLAGGIFLVFYMVRAMGAGDVKLMAAIGSLVGPRHAIVVLLATAICGGLLAIVYAVLRRRLGATFRNLGSVLWFHARSGLRVHPELNLDNASTLRMPYGLAIAAGTLYAFLAMWWR